MRCAAAPLLLPKPHHEMCVGCILKRRKWVTRRIKVPRPLFLYAGQAPGAIISRFLAMLACLWPSLAMFIPVRVCAKGKMARAHFMYVNSPAATAAVGALCAAK